MIQVQTIPRNEYPRPQFVRESWMNLNGWWQFDYDDGDEGVRARWYGEAELGRRINVPYVYQTKLSGIGETEFHPIVWYKRTFCVRTQGRTSRWLLNFGAVDYQAEVWVNGAYAGKHRGGHTSFTFDITELIKDGENTLTVRAVDEPLNLELPRGKQFWKGKSENIFYTGTTGIWQTVWLEEVPDNYVSRLFMTPDIDQKSVKMEIFAAKPVDGTVGIRISYKGQTMVEDEARMFKGKLVRSFFLDQNINLEWEHRKYEWTPENPVLFDVSLTFISGDGEADRIDSYFAMRKVSVENGRFLLNNRPYYQKLVLDQGYWKDSLLTAPADEDFVRDILLSKEMGFNGARKHQKVEDPRYLYHADRMGFLVWAEYSNAYIYSREYAERMMPEWTEAVLRDYNHPCIVAWVPLNESWGVDGIMYNREEQAHSQAMYYLTKSLDQTRLVISNDGWNHTVSDLLTIHDYEGKKETLLRRYQSKERIINDMPANRTLLAHGFTYENQPVIVSEFGGISFKMEEMEGWGYTSTKSPEEYALAYEAVVSAMLESEAVQGFVYTQLCDVEQETNGLLTYGREPKIPLETIRRINEGGRG